MLEPGLALVRWHNALLASLGVLLGAWCAAGAPGLLEWRVMSAACCAVALTAAANAWNDIDDVDIDRVAHPERPLPSGAMSAALARRIAWTAAIVSLPFALAAGWVLFAVTIPVLALMWSYSRLLKRHGLPGNIIVATLASLPFFYGAWAAGRPLLGAALVATAAPLHLAREIAKDLRDVAGDAGFRRTLPLAAGVSQARRALVGAATAFVAMLLPVGIARPTFAAAALPALALTAAGVLAALRGREASPRLFKAAMVLAMAAFIVARG